MANLAAVQGGDEVHAGEVDEAQTTIELVLDVLFHLLIQAIPLVHHQYHGAAGVEHEAEDAQVLIGDGLLGVDHQQADVGIFNRLEGLDDGELSTVSCTLPRRRTPAVSMMTYFCSSRSIGM